MHRPNCTCVTCVDALIPMYHSKTMIDDIEWSDSRRVKANPNLPPVSIEHNMKGRLHAEIGRRNRYEMK